MLYQTTTAPEGTEEWANLGANVGTSDSPVDARPRALYNFGFEFLLGIYFGKRLFSRDKSN